MRTVALEEHFTAPDLVRRIDRERNQPPRLPAEKAPPEWAKPARASARNR